MDSYMPRAAVALTSKLPLGHHIRCTQNHLPSNEARSESASSGNFDLDNVVHWCYVCTFVKACILN